MSDATREFDLVVFGATGFTGGMTAEYLAAHARPGLRWALAGRSHAKLEAVKAKLLATHAQHSGLGLIEADVEDAQSLQHMASRTRVVLTTVGPFVDYGEPLILACIAEGTDYLDSSGEREFVRKMVQRHGSEAANRGVRLVSSCGFDAIPTDLGVYFTVKQLPPDMPIDINGYMAFRGMFSGGTQRSAIKSLAGPSARAADYIIEQAGRRARILPAKIRHVPSLDAWVTPFDTVDPAIVLRSATSLNAYGPDFSYVHHMVHRSFFAAFIVMTVIGLLALMARIAPMRAMLLSAVRAPGQGPSEAEMDAGSFSLRLQAECDGKRLETEVAGGDPGYRETSMMLGQSALCLVEDREVLPPRVGALTPVEAMGDALLARLQAAGMRFRVREC